MRSRFAAPLLALPSPRMKSEPLLKGQPPTSPEVFAWRTTVAGAKRHSSTTVSVVIDFYERARRGGGGKVPLFMHPNKNGLRSRNHSEDASQIAIHHGSKKC